MAAEKRPTPSHRGTDVATRRDQHLSHRRKIRRGPAAHQHRQGEGLPPLRRGQRAAAGRNHVVRRARRSLQHVRQRRHRGHRLGSEIPARRRQADRPDGGRRRGARARSHARRARQDQRPGPHVPARDGHRAAAHARGRGRDRAAHRARQAGGHQVDLAHAARSRRRSSSSATSCTPASGPSASW